MQLFEAHAIRFLKFHFHSNRIQSLSISLHLAMHE